MKILALGAHLDDCELGAGATLNKFAERGDQITYVGFSWCGNKELSSECQRAAQILGYGNDVNIYNYPVRRFNEHRQDILDDMIKIRDKFSPDLVFTHSSTDNHQDHQIIHQETKRAFKTSQILGYDMPWNMFESYLICPSAIEERHLEKKIEALMQYKSQHFRATFDITFIRGLAKVRGVQFKCGLAEAFEVIKSGI